MKPCLLTVLDARKCQRQMERDLLEDAAKEFQKTSENAKEASHWPAFQFPERPKLTGPRDFMLVKWPRMVFRSTSLLLTRHGLPSPTHMAFPADNHQRRIM